MYHTCRKMEENTHATAGPSNYTSGAAREGLCSAVTGWRHVFVLPLLLGSAACSFARWDLFLTPMRCLQELQMVKAYRTAHQRWQEI